MSTTKKPKSPKTDMTLQTALVAFPAVIPQNAEILILGSMPGKKSLTLRQYYGHPQNAFWYVIADLAGLETPPTTYSKRIDLLHELKIALWDVCHMCDRKTSLDSDIENVKANNIEELLSNNPSIKAVLFNGGPVQSLYKKYCKMVNGVSYVLMPSTSPTYAKMKRKEKVEKWKEVMFVNF
ncbi:hypothetical protein QTN25_010087 [Entamoeba marina]